MNEETIRGKIDQTAGCANQVAGEAIGNGQPADGGLAQQAAAAAKETWSRVRQSAAEAAKRHHAKASGRWKR